MREIATVCFCKGEKRQLLDPAGVRLHCGARVVAETQQGLDLGTVLSPNVQVPDHAAPKPVGRVLRIATDDDLAQDRANRAREREAIAYCAERAAAHGLRMRLVDAHYTFDARRVTFYYSAENRVDFRGLLRDLAGTLRVRIEMRQLGVREQARYAGGYGVCGRELCCASWLSEFHPTAIRMAKDQGLSLNPTNISGLCGRLLCCLRYEQDTYASLWREAPAVGSRIETETGEGRVKEVSLLRGCALVEYEGAKREWHQYAPACPRVLAHADGDPLGRELAAVSEEPSAAVQGETELAEEVLAPPAESVVHRRKRPRKRSRSKQTGAPRAEPTAAPAGPAPRAEQPTAAVSAGGSTSPSAVRRASRRRGRRRKTQGG